MRTLQQIATENYVEHTARDIEIMEKVRGETVADLMFRLAEIYPHIAQKIEWDFWEDNPRGR